MTIDAFAHHPGLRDQIVDPETSFYRTLTTEVIRGLLAENGIDPAPLISDAAREDCRKRYLDQRSGGDLWVFGYGSLMWDPGLIFAEVRRARIDGYARRMILLDTLGARGTEASPGLMAALDRGPVCEGLAFRIDTARVENETRILWQRERVAEGYIPIDLMARIGDTDVPVLTFVADHNAEAIVSDVARTEQLLLLANSVGFLGSSLEYLQGIAAKLHLLGIEDADLFSLLDEAENATGSSEHKPHQHPL